MWCTPLLPLSPDPHWIEVVATDMLLSLGQIELFDIQTVYLCYTELLKIELLDLLTVCKQKTDFLIELLVIHSNTWNTLSELR